MKLKEEYVIYDASENERIAVATGDAAELFSGLLRANKTAGIIMEYLRDDITEDQIVSHLLNSYDADEDIIRSDVSKILETLRSVGAIEE